MSDTIYIKSTSQEMRRRMAVLPAILAGRAPDRHGIGRGFRLRLAVALLEKIKLAFVAKSRGGTDEAGDSWPKLSREYLAYGRRFAPGEKTLLKLKASNRQGGSVKFGTKAPGGKKGLLTAAQLKRWRKVYAQNLAWLAARESFGEAKAHAAAIAWSDAKKHGAQTKLDVFGSREVEILRDTGILFNSLSPGLLTSKGPDASYSPTPNQVVREGNGEVFVGTNVPYARAHHEGKRTKLRRLWPAAEKIPATWLNYLLRQASSGLQKGIELLAGDRAA